MLKVISDVDCHPADRYMQTWRDWMQRDSLRIGYPGASSGFVGGGYSRSVDDLTDDADDRVSVAVDAAVSGLPAQMRVAVLWRYGLSRVCPRACNVEESLREALDRVLRYLQAHGVAW